MPQVQFRVVTQRQNPRPESSEEVRDSTRSALSKMVDGPGVRFTGLRHGKDGRDPTVADRAANVELPKSRHPDF